MEVSLSACRVRAEYVDKHVRSIWTLPDIISTDSYAWALGLAPGGWRQRPTRATSNDRHVGEGGPNNSKRGDWRLGRNRQYR